MSFIKILAFYHILLCSNETTHYVTYSYGLKVSKWRPSGEVYWRRQDSNPRPIGSNVKMLDDRSSDAGTQHCALSSQMLLNQVLPCELTGFSVLLDTASFTKRNKNDETKNPKLAPLDLHKFFRVMHITGVQRLVPSTELHLAIESLQIENLTDSTQNDSRPSDNTWRNADKQTWTNQVNLYLFINYSNFWAQFQLLLLLS